MVSELRLDNMLPLFWQKKKHHKIVEIAILVYLDCFFFVQNMGQILFKLNSDTIFGILSPKRTLYTPNRKENSKIYFLASHSIFKISSVMHEPKKQFYGRKNDVVLLFTSHGTGLAPKTWKS